MSNISRSGITSNFDIKRKIILLFLKNYEKYITYIYVGYHIYKQKISLYGRRNNFRSIM